MLRVIRILILIFCFYNLFFIGRILPFTFVAGLDLSGMNEKQASTLLKERVKTPEKIILISESSRFEIETKNIDLSYDFDAATKRAFRITRTGNIIYDLCRRINLFFSPVNLGVNPIINEDKLSKEISGISKAISVKPVFPSAKISSGKVTIDKGKSGEEVDSILLRSLIGESLARQRNDNIQIPTKIINSALSDEEADLFRRSVESYVGKSILVNFEYDTFKIADNDILKILNPKGGFNTEEINNQIAKVAAAINRESQNPKFKFENGKVTEFLPAKDGIELNKEEFEKILSENLTLLAESKDKSITIEPPVTRIKPYLSTDKVNDLGIREIIGRGTSRFRGSIASRVYNIQLASSRLNGILIKPGEVFSFNASLGDVSKFTGFQEAYIISEGKTVLGDGGGVCQVSTTLFRAALNSGLPILERQAHAYRVGYYEQDSPPGLDATVYGPSPDLKIKNDTPNHILIQATIYSKTSTLIFELYGTSDGRVSTVSKPVVSDIIPAGEDLYVDDPTLPAGTIKQTEHKANGAKVEFNYIVERGGEKIYSKKFISVYRPWQAVFLRGTAPH